MNKNLKINYLYNSGFTVETENYLLIFDYYIDSVESGEKCIANGAIGETDLITDKKIIVFVSHRHPDHFNPVIFQWSKIRSDIEYVISNDIKKRIECDGIVHKMKAYEELALSDIQVKTFGSTDVGVSFLVTVDEMVIFHAGDLNWWYWYDATEQENKDATGRFKAEIERIKDCSIDIAFFPVDKRLKDAYCMGAEYFIDKISPKALVPMHFGNAYDATVDFYERMKLKDSQASVAVIQKRGQQIFI